MKRVWQWVRLGYLLLPSLAFSAAGLWLGYQSALIGNRLFARIGVFIFMGGMTVIPIGLWLVANYLFPSEHKQLFQSRKAAVAAHKIQKMEKALRSVQFMKRYPISVLLFILGALIVSSLMTVAPVLSPHDKNAVALHVMGIVLVLAYLVALILFLYAILTKKWGPYIDASIRQTEERLTRMKLEHKTNSPSISG